jgi:hypothetical protein
MTDENRQQQPQPQPPAQTTHFFTAGELTRLQSEPSLRPHEPKSRRSASMTKTTPIQVAPYAIRNVSASIFSIARHYGGVRAYSTYYVYLSESDELIRDDVFKLVMKWRKSAEKERKELEKKAKAEAEGRTKASQGELF